MKQSDTVRFTDYVFVCSSIVFNISVSIVYLATKFNDTSILQASGLTVIALIIPFGITLFGYIKIEAKKAIITANIVILSYLFLELLLDYVLLVPFRDILAIHIPYIVIFYAAEFSMIGITFDRYRKMGFVVLFTFAILIGCLVYLYAI
jgi:hypothetical protein